MWTMLFTAVGIHLIETAILHEIITNVENMTFYTKMLHSCTGKNKIKIYKFQFQCMNQHIQNIPKMTKILITSFLTIYLMSKT
jgi:hypothetical protein